MLSTSPYLYPLVSLAEIAVIAVVCKISGSKFCFEQVLNCLLSIAHWTVIKKKDQNEPNESFLRQKVVVSLHYINMLIIYLPLYLILNFVEGFEMFTSSHTNLIHLAALICYLLVGILYALLMAYYEKYANRWTILESELSVENTSDARGHGNENSSEAEETEGIRLLETPPKGFKPTGGVDPIRPDQTFMEENRQETKKILQKIKNKNQIPCDNA